jgi:hypothetical protein
MKTTAIINKVHQSPYKFYKESPVAKNLAFHRKGYPKNHSVNPYGEMIILTPRCAAAFPRALYS